MSVKIRLSRVGKKHAPFYRIVAIDSRKKRDGEYLENLGTYDPKLKQFIQFNFDGLNAWIAKGAELSDTVARLVTVYAKANAKAGVAKSEKPAAAEKPVKKAAVKKASAKKSAPKA